MDLTTSYLGLTLRNPVIASVTPASANLDHLRRLEDAGAAAVVLPSLFDDEHDGAPGDWRDTIVAAGTGNNPEAQQHYLPQAAAPDGVAPDRYLELVRRARECLAVPVIASLNSAAAGGWQDDGRLLEQAGASALELNLYAVPADLAQTGTQIEERQVQAVRALCGLVSIPLSVKMGVHWTNPGNMAQRFVQAGAAGLVIFGRLAQPDIDLRRLTLSAQLPLSQATDMRVPLQWVALLAGRVSASLAASTGVEDAAQVVKYLYAGADVVRVKSAIIRNGPPCLGTMVDGLAQWLEARGIASPDVIRGLMSFAKLKDPGAYTRAHR
jgi:dihydroorotate dehydrogenase (fumarate)